MKNHLFCQLQDWVSNCTFSPNCLFWPLILAHQPDQHLQGISLSRLLMPFWMQTSQFILHLFTNQTFHRQTNYTFKYRNMSLVANHSNIQSQLITDWKKGKEMVAPPSQSQCYPVSGMVTYILCYTGMHVCISFSFNNNNTYIFYSAIPCWASSTHLFMYMYIIYTIYIY